MMQHHQQELVSISAPHTAYYERLFQTLNPSGAAEVGASVAAQFLKSSNIDVAHLSQIWELADYRKVGSLDKRGAFIAFKLVAGVQLGHPVQPSTVSAPALGPPTFAGIPPANAPAPVHSPQLQRSNSVVSIPQTPIGGGRNHQFSRSPSVVSSGGGVPYPLPTTGDWVIEPAEQSKYEAIFFSLNPVNGKLGGEQCRPVLMKSQLHQAHLARIWELADVDKDGQMDKYEMGIALHLVYKCLQGEQLPDALPSQMIHPMKKAMLGQQPLSRRTSYTGGGGVQQPTRMMTPLTSGSRTASISSLTNSADGGDGLGAPPFKSIFSAFDFDWFVAVRRIEPTFIRVDTDADGWVNGGDIKEQLMRSGLPQHVLAQIWALADTARAGRLNVEQFALVMELVNECQHRVPLPETLPPHLIPPSMRPSQPPSSSINLPGSVSGGSLASGGGAPPIGTPTTPKSRTNSTSQGMPAAALAEDPKLKELNEEMERLVENRRQAEQDLFQLEADTTVKNSEIKNLEIEFLTLAATVKQLERQKGEASKRLGELDDKAERLEETCQKHTERIESEQERLAKVKAELSAASENLTEEEKLLAEVREEARQVNEEYSNVERELAEEGVQIERFVDQLTKMERKADADEKELERVEQLTKELSECLEKLVPPPPAVNENRNGNGEEKNVSSTVVGDEELLRLSFQRIDLSVATEGPTSPIRHPHQQFSGAIHESDPFKDDPFAGSDDRAFGVDPFVSGGAFSITAALAEDDPFASRPTANKISGGGGGGSKEFADFNSFVT